MKKIPVRKLVEIDFLQCPKCGWTILYPYGELVNGQSTYKCCRCNAKFTQEQIETLWKTVNKKIYAYRCEGCGEYISNTRENRNMLGIFDELLCPHCHEENGQKLIAINGYHVSRLRRMTFRNSITAVTTRKHKIILRYLNILAKKENPEVGFRSVPQENIQAYVTTLDKPVGYIAYTKDERFGGLPVIRQLFVVKEERRKGHAAKLVKHLLKNECKQADKDGNLFVIESPNNKSLGLFQKLSYAKIDDNGIRFISCYMIQCM